MSWTSLFSVRRIMEGDWRSVHHHCYWRCWLYANDMKRAAARGRREGGKGGSVGISWSLAAVCSAAAAAAAAAAAVRHLHRAACCWVITIHPPHHQQPITQWTQNMTTLWECLMSIVSQCIAFYFKLKINYSYSIQITHVNFFLTIIVATKDHCL